MTPHSRPITFGKPKEIPHTFTKISRNKLGPYSRSKNRKLDRKIRLKKLTLKATRQDAMVHVPPRINMLLAKKGSMESWDLLTMKTVC